MLLLEQQLLSMIYQFLTMNEFNWSPFKMDAAQNTVFMLTNHVGKLISETNSTDNSSEGSQVGLRANPSKQF